MYGCSHKHKIYFFLHSTPIRLTFLCIVETFIFLLMEYNVLLLAFPSE